MAGIADMAIAMVIFAALAATLVAVFARINLWRGAVVIDVRAILDAPGDYAWVVIMVASTLLPTLVHLGLAAFSVITWVPVPLWRGLVRRIDPDESAVLTHWSAAGFAAMAGVLYLLPIGLIIAALYGLWQISAPLLEHYLALLHLLLDWMGEPGVQER